MSYEEATTSPEPPSGDKSATEMGYFPILGEVVGFLLLLFVGFQFLMPEARSDAVGWILFGLAALTMVDIIRRTMRAVRM